MWAGLGLLLVLLIIITIVLPWVNRSQIAHLTDEIRALRRQVAGLGGTTVNTTEKAPATPIKPTAKTTATAAPLTKLVSETPATTSPWRTNRNWQQIEQHFMLRWPIWLGALALAFAGFYLVKWSIEVGLLSPTVRVIGGGIFGLGLLYIGRWVGMRHGISNGLRIAQGLTGAGLFCLYTVSYAAYALYGLIPSWMAFASLAFVTFAALALALRHGAPIAIIGLAGGLLTPALIDSQNPSAPLLFTYLYLLFSAVSILLRKTGWWWLSLPAIAGVGLWFLLWIFGGAYQAGDNLWLGLFLLAVSGTITLSVRGAEIDSSKPALLGGRLRADQLFTALGLTGTLLGMGLLVHTSHQQPLSWGLFGLLTLASFALARFEPERYRVMPWLALGVTLALFVQFPATSDLAILAVMLVSFAGIFLIGSQLLLWRDIQPVQHWAWLQVLTLVGFAGFAYLRFEGSALEPALPLFWPLLMLIVSAVCVAQLQRQMDAPGPANQHTLAAFATGATALLSIGLAIILPVEYFSVAAAGQLFALALLSGKLQVTALPRLAWLMFIGFLLLLAPQFMLLIKLFSLSLVGSSLYFSNDVPPFIASPLLQLGIPALLFLLAAPRLAALKDTASHKLAYWLELTTHALIVLTGYYLMRHFWFPDTDSIMGMKATFTQRAVLTTLLAIYGLACLRLRGTAPFALATRHAGLAMLAIAVFRVIWFDLLIDNPLLEARSVGGTPLFNGLLLAYGAPLIWLAMALRHGELPLGKRASQGIYALMLFLAFWLITTLIRQYYHGSILTTGAGSRAEIISYSAGWLALGIALMWLAIRYGRPTYRLGSLVILLLTIGKVFLYDASELEGLLRVVSFLGLGISLIALGWVYARYVFVKDDGDTAYA